MTSFPLHTPTYVKRAVRAKFRKPNWIRGIRSTTLPPGYDTLSPCGSAKVAKRRAKNKVAHESRRRNRSNA